MKNLIMTKLKKSNCDKTQKNLTLWQKSKTQIMTVVIVSVVTVAVVTVVIVTSFNKDKLTPQKPMICSWCSFLQFYLCSQDYVFNRPVVARFFFFKYLCPPLIHWFIELSFSSESSRHCVSQTVRAGELKFWENAHPPPCVTCHMSRVTFCFSLFMG